MEQKLDCNHTWPLAVYFGVTLSFAVFLDIFSHAVVMSFLPAQLAFAKETSWTIALVIGVYYLMGWVVNVALTSTYLLKLFSGTLPMPSWAALNANVGTLIMAVTATIMATVLQAQRQEFGLGLVMTHLIARAIQGVAGGIIFYYAFLVVGVAFTGHQQTFANTAVSCASHVGGVMAPFMGAVVYTYFGERATFLGAISLGLITVCLLIGMYFAMPRDDKEELMEGQGLLRQTTPVPDAGGWEAVGLLFKDRALLRALLCCGPPDVLRSAFEVFLPLFAAVKGYPAWDIGLFLMIPAMGLVCASILLGATWTDLSPRARTGVGAGLMISLGCVGCVVLALYDVDPTHVTWFCGLFAFGALTGVDVVSTYHIGDFEDKQLQPAATGVWNTSWVLACVVGTFVSGFAEPEDPATQQQVLVILGILCIIGGCLLTMI